MKKGLSSMLVVCMMVPIVLYVSPRPLPRSGATLAMGKRANTNSRVMATSSKPGTPIEIDYQGYLVSTTDTTGVTGKVDMIFRL